MSRCGAGARTGLRSSPVHHHADAHEAAADIRDPDVPERRDMHLARVTHAGYTGVVRHQRDAVRRAWKVKLKPTVIVCDTVKGKGVPFTESKANYHGVALSKEEMAVAIPILEAELKKHSAQPQE